MNLYALFLLCAVAISITLGLSVFYLNRRSRINKLFMISMLLNAYWAFCLFMINQSPSSEGAFFWNKMLFLWPFLIPAMFHFTLAFTESKLLQRKLIYGALYFPAVLFSLIDLTTNWLSANPILQSWGYATAVPIDSMMSRFDGIWAGALGLLAIFLFVNYYNRILDRTKKQQTKFVALGFSSAIVVSILTDSLFQVMSIDFPTLGTISASFGSFFVLYAMIKYELFSFRPEIAAENIFSTMPDSLILVSLEGKIMKVNRSLIELTGYAESELIGRQISELLQQANVVNKEKMAPQIISQLRIQRELKDYEITFYTKFGEKKIGSLSCSIITDNIGQDVGVAFVLHDMTGNKIMEQKLLRSERFASIGELAGMVGHDLRNPLSGIRGATYYLKRKLNRHLDAEDLAMFDTIDKSIEYSNKIINDLLEYSNEINLEIIPVTPKSLILGSLSHCLCPDNVGVVDETVDEPKFRADEDRLYRAFANIIKNAFDAMPYGGELRITSELVADKIHFTFRDNGFGMTEETLSKLWTPLFTTKAKGMGFGLAISKRIIEAHGGRIMLESTLEKGTTVSVELPFE